ncbi:MAG: ABC transporter permease [Vulcanimicrobiaceae bacterium]
MRTLVTALHETRADLLTLVRTPAYALPTLLFPLAFYVFFGVIFAQGHAHGAAIATYLLATYGTFGIVGAALFSFGVGVAIERGRGWLTLKRASPMPIGAYFLARTVTCAVFAAAIVVAMFAVGASFGGVRLPLAEWLVLALTLVAGTVPFCALGLAFGLLAGPSSAAPLVNLIYLPMSFLSGLWIPLDQLPAFLRHVAVVFPTFHLGQLALDTIGFGDGAIAVHVIALLAFTSFGVTVAALAWMRDERPSYG